MGYASRRGSDPSIAKIVRDAMGHAQTVLNVGSGTGSYEPSDLKVVALEPSAAMIVQRETRKCTVQGKAEFLPFEKDSFDVTMAVLTLHHWEDQRRGLEECLRVARQRVVILTWDPSAEGFWLVQDYFPEIIYLDRKIFPSLDFMRQILGPITIHGVSIPAHCQDGFLGAYWRRPEAYLQRDIRAGISSFSRIPEVESRIERLRKDLESEAWDRKYGDHRRMDFMDLGYRIVVADLR